MNRERPAALDAGTVAAVWADFADRLLDGWPVDIRQQMRHAFYAGAAGMSGLLRALHGRPPEEIAAAVGRFREELDRYFADAQAGRA